MHNMSSQEHQFLLTLIIVLGIAAVILLGYLVHLLAKQDEMDEAEEDYSFDDWA